MLESGSSNSNFFTWVQAQVSQTGRASTQWALVRLVRYLRYWREMEQREKLMVLANTTPEHLADLGITNVDLKAAMELPLHISAGQWLERRRQQRRA